MTLGLASLQAAYNAKVDPPHVTVVTTKPLTIAEPTASSGTTLPALVLGRAAGNAAAGDGVGFYYGITSANGTARIAALVDVDWDDPSNGAESAAYVISVMSAGSMVEAFRADQDGVVLSATGAIYLGDKNTDGTWRIIRDGNDLAFQRREAGAWVEKLAPTAD